MYYFLFTRLLEIFLKAANKNTYCHNTYLLYKRCPFIYTQGFPGSSAGNAGDACNAGDPCSISRSGRLPWRRDRLPTSVFLGFPSGSSGKESACNVGDLDSIPGLGRSPGEGSSYPLQYSCLENSQGQRNLAGFSPWVAKNRTGLSDFHTYTHVTLCNSMDYSPLGSTVYGIPQIRILELFAMPSSRGSSQLRDQAQVF